MIKKYRQAPLPFQGQKRNHATRFASEISALPDDTIFVDLFGGSGLLSRTAKDIKPKSRVIYNDFDNFQVRLKNIAATNVLLAEVRELLAEEPYEKTLSKVKSSEVLRVIKKHDKKGFVDYITLSTLLLFSMKYVNNYDELKKSTLYNKVKSSDYCDASTYLHGLEIRRCDYRELFDEFKSNKKVFFICDPPYLSTDAKTYKMYWKLRDYLAVLDCLRGTQFAFFTSGKSTILELLEWLESYGLKSPFAGAKITTIESTVNKCTKYRDIMIFKAFKRR